MSVQVTTPTASAATHAHCQSCTIPWPSTDAGDGIATRLHSALSCSEQPLSTNTAAPVRTPKATLRARLGSCRPTNEPSLLTEHVQGDRQAAPYYCRCARRARGLGVDTCGSHHSPGPLSSGLGSAL